MMTRETEPFTVTVRDACRRTGLGRTLLYELAQSGKVERRMIGARNYVLVWSSLKSWIDRQSDQPRDAW